MIWIQLTLAFIVGLVCGYFGLALSVDSFPTLDKTINVVDVANLCLTAAIALIFGQFFSSFQSARAAQRDLLREYLKTVSETLHESNRAFFECEAGPAVTKSAYRRLINALRELANAVQLLESAIAECKHTRAQASIAAMKDSYFVFKQRATDEVVVGRKLSLTARSAEHVAFRSLTRAIMQTSVAISAYPTWRQ